LHRRRHQGGLLGGPCLVDQRLGAGGECEIVGFSKPNDSLPLLRRHHYLTAAPVPASAGKLTGHVVVVLIPWPLDPKPPGVLARRLFPDNPLRLRREISLDGPAPELIVVESDREASRQQPMGCFDDALLYWACDVGHEIGRAHV